MVKDITFLVTPILTDTTAQCGPTLTLTDKTVSECPWCDFKIVPDVVDDCTPIVWPTGGSNVRHVFG